MTTRKTMLDLTTELAMAPDLMPLVRSGEKLITIRNGIRWVPLIPTRVYNAEDDTDSVPIVPHTIMHTRLDLVPYELLVEDGFDDEHHALERLRRFYPDIELHSPVTVIQWYLPE